MVETLNPIEIEIGCGKGRYLMTRAEQNPEIQFLGIDRVEKWMKRRAKQIERRNLSNLKFVKAECHEFLKDFPAESVSAFHIYFPDPWPKRRHHRRRLVTTEFLTLLQKCLQPGGRVELATDDRDYFAQIKREAAACEIAWHQIKETINARPLDPEIKTNYELKYEAAGKAIYYLELKKSCHPRFRGDDSDRGRE